MNLRGQILFGSLLLTVLPLLLVVQIIRSQVTDRFTELDTQHVVDQTRLVKKGLEHRSDNVADRLSALTEKITQDNRFRLAAITNNSEYLPYLRDYAGRHMSLMDLDMLQIQDQTGRVLSSGHHRGAFDLQDEHLPVLLSRIHDGRALITVPSPAGPSLSLCRAKPLDLGGNSFYLIGGLAVNSDQLHAMVSDPSLALAIVWPDSVLSTSKTLATQVKDEPDLHKLDYMLQRNGYITQSSALVMIKGRELIEARLLVVHDRSSLTRLLKELNIKLALALLLAVTFSIVLAVFFANTISRPLRNLAAATESLDLQRLDADFSSNRRDEVGSLTRLLGQMTIRLRDGVARLRDAEHKATLGEISRQINHDIRNGITPLRNVLNHMSQIAETKPDDLETIYLERRHTLESGLDYLDELATHYARLSTPNRPQACYFDQILSQILPADATVPYTVTLDIANNLPPVTADPISLRRILENLTRNAVDSLPDNTGEITVAINVLYDDNLAEDRLVVTVSDTGVGISRENLELIFNDFFTTKDHGTGLGLSNVRRLVGDCGGSIKVASEPGQGTTFTLSFPILTSQSGEA